MDGEARRLLQEAADIMLDTSYMGELPPIVRGSHKAMARKIQAYLDRNTPDAELVQAFFAERKADKCGEDYQCWTEHCHCLADAQERALWEKQHPVISGTRPEGHWEPLEEVISDGQGLVAIKG